MDRAELPIQYQRRGYIPVFFPGRRKGLSKFVDWLWRHTNYEKRAKGLKLVSQLAAETKGLPKIKGSR